MPRGAVSEIGQYADLWCQWLGLCDIGQVPANLRQPLTLGWGHGLHVVWSDDVEERECLLCD